MIEQHLFLLLTDQCLKEKKEPKANILDIVSEEKNGTTVYLNANCYSTGLKIYI